MKPPSPLLLWEVPTPTLPKPASWWTRNKADADAMVAWVNERLTVRFAERMNQEIIETGDQWKIDPETGLATITYLTLQDRKDIARWDGDAGPLREEYPEIDDCIFPPNRGRGGGKHHRNRKAEDAAKDVRFIRELWQREYGRWKRPESNPPTAEQIAADFHEVDVRSVRSALKRLK